MKEFDKEICELSTEDLRIMIEQEFSLNDLVPIALELLEKSPLAKGSLYPGDLLYSVLKINTSFWQKKFVLQEEVRLYYPRCFTSS